MPVPDFSPGEVLTAAAMDSVGLWLITSGTQTGSTALNLDGVFTTNFTNYRLLIANAESTVANRAMRLNFRAAGSTNASANYGYAFRGLRESGAGGDTSLQTATFAEIGIYLGDFADLPSGFASIDILDPKGSKRTSGLGTAQGYEGTAFQFRSGGFVYNGNTSFDGIRITLSDTGNITFNYQLYGYRK
jgi:hypothetical protein